MGDGIDRHFIAIFEKKRAFVVDGLPRQGFQPCP